MFEIVVIAIPLLCWLLHCCTLMGIACQLIPESFFEKKIMPTKQITILNMTKEKKKSETKK